MADGTQRGRTCPSCGREKPPENDFCECGEYLAWEPDGYAAGVPAAPVAEAPEADPAAPGLPPPVAIQTSGAEPAPEPPAQHGGPRAFVTAIRRALSRRRPPE